LSYQVKEQSYLNTEPGIWRWK